MKSKLVVATVTVLACATWWTGCSSSIVTSTSNPDSGGAIEAGDPDTGVVTEAGTDAVADAGVDSALSGPFIDITYGSCAAFTPCGGDPTGSYKISGGCVGNGAFAAAKSQCPGIVESNVKFQARGTIVTDATTVKRNTELKLSATLAIPAQCVAAIGTCADVEAAILFIAKVDKATCAAGDAGSCDCEVMDTTLEKSEDTYTKSATTITTSNPTRTFDYCVNGAGTEIQYLETTANSVPVTFTIAK